MINRNRGTKQIPVDAMWAVIQAATQFRGIVLTVPLDPCDHLIPTYFQVRCWRLESGRSPKKGHIDGGDMAIFEVLMDKPLGDEGWEHRLSTYGVDVLPSDFGFWRRELCTADDGSQYYNITFLSRR
ncbi:MAG: hypothetical protein HYZ63_01240 [Candidatus Andersenbacteria bacterium]|nr:hypothetical protein [Candidatus Andersenbacteria bacterium]